MRKLKWTGVGDRELRWKNYSRSFSHAFYTNVEMLSRDIFIDTRFDIYTNDLYENATRTKKSQKITGEEPDISLVT